MLSHNVQAAAVAAADLDADYEAAELRHPAKRLAVKDHRECGDDGVDVECAQEETAMAMSELPQLPPIDFIQERGQELYGGRHGEHSGDHSAGHDGTVSSSPSAAFSPLELSPIRPMSPRHRASPIHSASPMHSASLYHRAPPHPFAPPHSLSTAAEAVEMQTRLAASCRQAIDRSVADLQGAFAECDHPPFHRTFLADLLRVLHQPSGDESAVYHIDQVHARLSLVKQLVVDQCRMEASEDDPDVDASAAFAFYAHSRNMVMQKLSAIEATSMPVATMHAHMLAMNIWLRIFQHVAVDDPVALYRCALTCRAWRNAIAGAGLLASGNSSTQQSAGMAIDSVADAVLPLGKHAPLLSNVQEFRHRFFKTAFPEHVEDGMGAAGFASISPLLTTSVANDISVEVIGDYLCWVDPAQSPTAVLYRRLGDTCVSAVQTLDAHTGCIHQMAPFHCLPNHVATASDDGTIFVWNLARGKWRYRITPHDGCAVVNMHCEPSAARIISVGSNGTVAISTDRSTKIVMQLFGADMERTDNICVSLAGDYFVVGTPSANFYVFTVEGAHQHTLRDPLLFNQDDENHHAEFTVIHDRFIAAHSRRAHEICIWDLVSGHLLHRLSEAICAPLFYNVDPRVLPRNEITLIEFRRGMLVAQTRPVGENEDGMVCEMPAELLIFDFLPARRRVVQASAWPLHDGSSQHYVRYDDVGGV